MLILMLDTQVARFPWPGLSPNAGYTVDVPDHLLLRHLSLIAH